MTQKGRNGSQVKLFRCFRVTEAFTSAIREGEAAHPHAVFPP